MYTIKELTQKEAAEKARDIVYLNRTVWLDTYVNEKAGITKDDIRTKYVNMADLVVKMKKQFLLSQDRDVWIAEVDNKLIGYCFLNKIEDWFKITSLYIHPNSQRKGIGKELMGKMMDVVDNEKCFLESAAHNEKAINFYKKYGFEISSEQIDDYKLPNGKTFKLVRMIKN